jgi:hypothetical protein
MQYGEANADRDYGVGLFKAEVKKIRRSEDEKIRK